MSRVTYKGNYLSNDQWRYYLRRRLLRRYKFTEWFVKKFAAVLPPALPLTMFQFQNRASTFLIHFFSKRIRIYNGKLWRNLRLSKWQIGMRAGGFVKTKALAMFKKKTLTKKKKPISGKQALKAQLKIQTIKQFKAGLRRKPGLIFNVAQEAQYKNLEA